MKGLAEFVMRGRMQALMVTVAGAGSLLFCWISAAVIALVTLRKGVGQGMWLFVWAMLPAGVLLYVYGDSGPLTLLAGALLLAVVLRQTVSLPLTVLCSVVVGLVTGLGIMAFGGAYLDQLVALFSDFLGNLEQRIPKGEKVVELPRPVPSQVAGMLGAGTAMLATLSLLLGRYWQAALYNPGGFGVEFKALRFPLGVCLALVLVALVLSSQGLEFRTWAMIFFIPLSFAGLALVHARVAARGQSTGWLTWFYLAWIVFDPVKMLVVFFAIADSWLDFRQRWSGRGPRKDKEGENATRLSERNDPNDHHDD